MGEGELEDIVHVSHGIMANEQVAGLHGAGAAASEMRRYSPGVVPTEELPTRLAERPALGAG